MLDKAELIKLSAEELADKLISLDKDNKTVIAKRDEYKAERTKANEELTKFKTEIETKELKGKLSETLKTMNVKEKFIDNVINGAELIEADEADIKKKVLEYRKEYEEYFNKIEPEVSGVKVPEKQQATGDNNKDVIVEDMLKY